MWEATFALMALTVMEIVLGIDNIIFISILTDRLPEERQASARRLGLLLAMGARVVLLLGIRWILGLTEPFLYLSQMGLSEELLRRLSPDHWEQINGISGKDLILVTGGLFLIGKSVLEIHHQFDRVQQEDPAQGQSGFGAVLIQIMLLDIVFSLDSVITAVGMVRDVRIMITAVVLSILVMMAFAGRISRFVQANPTLKMLALSFLILIGVMLVAEAAGTEINKGYIYFAMAFSVIVEMLNLRLRSSKDS